MYSLMLITSASYSRSRRLLALKQNPRGIVSSSPTSTEHFLSSGMLPKLKVTSYVSQSMLVFFLCSQKSHKVFWQWFMGSHQLPGNLMGTPIAPLLAFIASTLSILYTRRPLDLLPEYCSLSPKFPYWEATCPQKWRVCSLTPSSYLNSESWRHLPCFPYLRYVA